MTDTPEPDVATQLKVVGKKYLRYLEVALDSAIQDTQQDMKDDIEDLESTQPVRRVRKPRAKKPVAKPSTKNLGFARWLKGPKVEERKDS